MNIYFDKFGKSNQTSELWFDASLASYVIEHEYFKSILVIHKMHYLQLSTVNFLMVYLHWDKNDGQTHNTLTTRG